jgi:hypothetical protein
VALRGWRRVREMKKRMVETHEKGWEVRAPGAARASSVHERQADAIARAKEIVRGLGGGEVLIKGRDGRFRDSDTIAPAPDPCPPKDKK